MVGKRIRMERVVNRNTEKTVMVPLIHEGWNAMNTIATRYWQGFYFYCRAGPPLG
jgi:hypothetical protein